MDDNRLKRVPFVDHGKDISSVEEEFQSIIQFLWDREIDAFDWCMDNEWGIASIHFELFCWMRVTTAAFHSKARDLYNFIEDECQIFLLVTDDGQPDENEEDLLEGDELIWGASVTFPKERLVEFERLLRETLRYSWPAVRTLQ